MFGKTVFAIIHLMVIGVCLSGENKSPGAGVLLRFGLDARAIGMGGAFTAQADNASAFYWNPAGMDAAGRVQLGGMYSIMNYDRRYQYAAVTIPLSWLGSIGFSWIGMSIDNIDGRDAYGNAEGTFADAQHAFHVSYSRVIIGRKNKSAASFDYFSYARFSKSSESFDRGFTLAFGANAKYLSHSLAHEKADGFGFDAGLLASYADVVRLGVNVRDITSSWKWESGLKEEFPLCIRAGAALGGGSLPFTAVFDAEFLEHQDPTFYGGGEIWLRYLALRSGYNQGFVFGGSVRFSSENLIWEISYSYTPARFADDYMHQSSLAVRF